MEPVALQYFINILLGFAMVIAVYCIISLLGLLKAAFRAWRIK
jgi:hypothetical protein